MCSAREGGKCRGLGWVGVGCVKVENVLIRRGGEGREGLRETVGGRW